MTFENVSKAATHAVEAMKSIPLAIAIITVNIVFLLFASFVLGEVADNARNRDKTQIETINTLIKELIGCGTSRRSTAYGGAGIVGGLKCRSD